MSVSPPKLASIIIELPHPGVAVFYYNLPKIANAFTVEMYRDLAKALDWARLESSIKVVVQTGKGRFYCAGKAMIPGVRIEDEVQAGGEAGRAFREFDKILIAAVNGPSVGWGATQLFNYDLVYAYDKAFFLTPFMSLGFVPEGASSYTFPLQMGKHKANSLLLAGDRMSAQEASSSNFITGVIDASSVEEFVEKVVAKAKVVASYNIDALKMAKALITRNEERREQVAASEREREKLLIRLNSPDAKAAIANFASESKSAKL